LIQHEINVNFSFHADRLAVEQRRLVDPPLRSECRPTSVGIAPHFISERSSGEKRNDGNEMMPIAPLPLTKQKNLTEVGHLGDHSHNQRRFA
jgi:hypothetical protein